MKNQAIILIAILTFVSMVTADPNAVISPSDPSVIVLDSNNNYEVTRQFDGSASDGSSFSWNNLESGNTDTGTIGQFTFDRNSSKRTRIRLTVSNGTHSDTTTLTGGKRQFLRDKPEVDIAASTKSVNIGETVSFTSDVQNYFDNSSLDYTWKKEGSDDGGSGRYQTSFSSKGTKTVNLTVTDNASDTGYDSVTIDVSSSGNEDNTNDRDEDEGSGTGGSIVSVTDNGRGEKQSRVFSGVKAGETVELNLGEKVEKLGVDRVSVTVEDELNRMKITVEQSKMKPDEVSEDVAEPVYSYIDIEATNVNESEIKQGRIEFSVNKTWINRNKINLSSVKLNRYDAGGWEELKTEIKSESSDKYKFTAVSPGFSYFAVSGQEKEEESYRRTKKDGDDEEKNGTRGQEVVSSNESEDDTGEASSENSRDQELISDIFVPILAGFALILLLYFVYFKDKEMS